MEMTCLAGTRRKTRVALVPPVAGGIDFPRFCFSWALTAQPQMVASCMMKVHYGRKKTPDGFELVLSLPRRRLQRKEP